MNKALELVLPLLETDDLASCMVVSQSWCAASQDDKTWAKLLARDFQIAAETDTQSRYHQELQNLTHAPASADKTWVYHGNFSTKVDVDKWVYYGNFSQTLSAQKDSSDKTWVYYGNFSQSTDKSWVYYGNFSQSYDNKPHQAIQQTVA